MDVSLPPPATFDAAATPCTSQSQSETPQDNTAHSPSLSTHLPDDDRSNTDHRGDEAKQRDTGGNEDDDRETQDEAPAGGIDREPAVQQVEEEEDKHSDGDGNGRTAVALSTTTSAAAKPSTTSQPGAHSAVAHTAAASPRAGQVTTSPSRPSSHVYVPPRTACNADAVSASLSPVCDEKAGPRNAKELQLRTPPPPSYLDSAGEAGSVLPSYLSPPIAQRPPTMRASATSAAAPAFALQAADTLEGNDNMTLETVEAVKSGSSPAASVSSQHTRKASVTDAALLTQLAAVQDGLAQRLVSGLNGKRKRSII